MTEKTASAQELKEEGLRLFQEGLYEEAVVKFQDAQKMFARFVEIEEGHQAIVKAEIDAVSGSGFWFDFNEFSLEKEL